MAAVAVSAMLLAGIGDAAVAGRSGSIGVGVGSQPTSSAAELALAVGSAAASSVILGPSADGSEVLVVTPSVGPSALPVVDPSTVPTRATAEQPAWPTPDDLAAAYSGVNLVYRVKTQRKVVALTFDDGWSPARGKQILAILLKNHVPATFFVNSVYVRWDPDLWREIAQDGFVIGNHTYDHRDLTTLTPSQVIADLDKDARVFEALTGQTMAPIVRPPYGARNATTDEAMVLAGYPSIVLWNVVAGDASVNAVPSREIASALKGGPGSIVLLHVGPVTTLEILQAVINGYRARGFSFLTIPQLLALR